MAAKLLGTKNVEIFADPDSFKILKNVYPAPLLKKASAGSFGREFLSQKMSIKTVKSIDEAIEHITKYSSQHSEAILSENEANCKKFEREIDAGTHHYGMILVKK